MLASFIGSAISLSPAIEAGRFKLLPLYDSLNSIDSWRSHVAVRLTNGAYRSLKYFWSCLQPADCSVSWDPRQHDEMLFTDSSDFALGAHLSTISSKTVLSGPWSTAIAN